MPTPIDDRFKIAATARTLSVVISIGDVEIAAKMPAVGDINEKNEERVR